MKLKVLSQIMLMFLLSVSIAQAATNLTVLGKHPFYQPPLSSVDDLKTMMEKRKSEVIKGLQVAGYPQLADPLMAQFSSTQIKLVQYDRGQTFLWMFFKTNGKGKVHTVKDMTWAGNKPFPGYEFSIELDGQRYIFAVPLICGNLALKSVEAIVVVPEPVVEEPVVEAIEEIVAPPPSPFGFVADVGYLRLPDPADYVFGRVGVEYQTDSNFSFLGMVGGAPKTGGADGKSAFLIDVLAQYNLSSVYFGVGLGGWITSGDSDIPSEDTDLDFIGNVGVRVLGEPETFNTSIFMETRIAVDEFDEIKDYGRFGAGIRFSL